MLNRITLLIACVLLVIKMQAQVVRIDSFESNYAFTGLATNGMMAYTYRVDESGTNKTASLEIAFCMADYANVKKFKVGIAKGAKVLASVFSDEGFLFLTGDAVSQTRKLIQVNIEGAVNQQYTESGVEAQNMMSADNYYLFNSLGFTYLIVPVLEKKGYKLTVFDNELKQIHTKIYTGKANMEVVTAKLLMDRILILEKETTDAKQAKYQYSIRQVSANMPDASTALTLNDEQDYCFPMFINAKDGMVHTAGLYYKNGKYEDGKAGGLMVYQLSQDGMVMKKTKVPMSKVNQFLPDAWIAALSKNTYLAIQDAYTGIAGNTVVVAEMIQKNMKAKDALVKVSDMLVMQISVEDELTKLQFAEKAPELNIVMSGKGVENNLLHTTEWLASHNLRNYKFSVMLMGQQHICYQAGDTNQAASTVMLLPIDSLTEGMGSRMLISLLPDPNRLMARPSIVRVNTDKPDDARVACNRYYGFMPTGDMRLFVYNLVPPVLQWTVEHIRK